MKKISTRLVLALMLVTTLHTGCGSSASLLSSASPLMSALGGNPSLSTMSSVLQTPGLGKLLGGSMKGPFTLLAPSNDAFKALGTDALGNLTKPENLNSLAGILKNHIVPGKLDAGGLANAALKTAGGSPLNLGGVNLGNLISTDKANIIPIDKILK
ncbi:MAG: hypothetical protein RL172_3300 [Bacteroidota bacterium]|jgi:uncharacterized surface protein with fasciclin (FAS1) repeats